jgi:hypothetical protein
MIFDEDHENDTLQEWKAYLKQLYDNGTPVVIEYAMTTPIITDISKYLDDIILEGISYTNPIKFDGFVHFPISEGVGGGEIEFADFNYTERAVPSSITYLLKEE